MVLVTDKQFYMDKGLKVKIDLMIKRCTGKNKQDNTLLVEGGEGDGKSNMSGGIGYYVAYQTGRPFGLKNFFFDINEMLRFAIETEDQVIIWDEPVLAGLSTDWWKEEQKNLLKVLMMARKKRHFFIFNFTKFYKFSEYIVVDRSIGMVHVYQRRELEPGHFVYFNKKQKEYLYNAYRSAKRRHYKKYYSLHGTFPEVLSLIVDEVAYDKKKDEAINSILDAKKNSKFQVRLNEVHKNILEDESLDVKAKARLLGVKEHTIRGYISKLKKAKSKDVGIG